MREKKGWPLVSRQVIDGNFTISSNDEDNDNDMKRKNINDNNRINNDSESGNYKSIIVKDTIFDDINIYQWHIWGGGMMLSVANCILMK